jgi:hypothetical protein
MQKILLKNPALFQHCKKSYSNHKKRRSKIPVDGFLRYRQGDLNFRRQLNASAQGGYTHLKLNFAAHRPTDFGL